ncbi:hypothetical protein DPMN_031482 [Dreissena polymorpha]|uniref:Uncharacterized protein n=1 Tax=Dreissena polymorpha TaxID=45954 RepID=A0A9D4M297_DREPO|nr:hypothetical protein DPMN_031482 [Dreissena polymorpha]
MNGFPDRRNERRINERADRRSLLVIVSIGRPVFRQAGRYSGREAGSKSDGQAGRLLYIHSNRFRW